MKTELTIHCRWHSEIVLKTLLTDDGYVVYTTPGHWTSEVVGGWTPTDEELRDLGMPRTAGIAVAQPAAGKEAHWRDHLRCPRPGCKYHAEIERRGAEQLHYLVLNLHRLGVARYAILDLDLELRKVDRSDADVQALLWVWMRHPDTQDRHRVPNNPVAIAHQESRGWTLEA